MSFFSFFEDPENEVSLLFDINSRSVGGAVVQLSRHGKPTIFYDTREKISFHTKPTADDMISGTISALSKVSHRLQKEGLPKLAEKLGKTHKIKEIFFIFSAPWYVSQTKVITLKKEQPFTFTSAVLKEMIEHEKQEAIKHLNGEKKVPDKNSLELLEQKIIQIQLNGYETSQPIGKKTVSVEVSLCLSFIPTYLRERVRDTVLHFFHPKKLEFHTFPIASYSVLRDLFPKENNFLLLDVNAEITEVSLVREGTLLETLSFPRGYAHLVRQISSSLQCSKELAVSTITLYLEKKTTEEKTKKIEIVLERNKKEWMGSFEFALQSLGEMRPIPKRAFLISEKPFNAFFAKVIEGIDTTILDKYVTGNHVISDNLIMEDECIALEAIFLNKIFRGE